MNRGKWSAPHLSGAAAWGLSLGDNAAEEFWPNQAFNGITIISNISDEDHTHIYVMLQFGGCRNLEVFGKGGDQLWWSGLPRYTQAMIRGRLVESIIFPL